MLNPLFLAVRHGYTSANATGNYRGWSDVPLTGQGRDVIREAALFLQGTGLSFPLVMSDDLARSVESRTILKDLLQIPVAQTDKRLRPLNVGDFTGKSKTEHPIEEYAKNPSRVIPGGESINQFDKRQAKCFDDVAAIIEKLKNPILIVFHGSTVSFLHNHFNAGGEKVGYEGLVNPGGVLMFTSKGIEPLTQKREGAASSLAQGTALAGYVTPEENLPPRECWACKWFSRDSLDLGACWNPVVRIDPQLSSNRQNDNSVAVDDRGCCNYFVSKRQSF